ncbi:MAG: amino acid synthesis family protein [Burkholderiaceae bacterium]|jgi:hypothetical protein|nr:amino acid synthesis family protein [Burkholderiales bacterium]MBP7566671.1 amino acid synthesis family protein [Burkholderiaceae bacterium]
MQLKIKRTLTLVESQLVDHQGHEATPPLVKAAVVVVVDNPFAGRYVEDLSPYVKDSVRIGELMGRMAVEAMAGREVQSYGKGAIVGINGEQEHAAALLTSDFAAPIRRAIGGGKAWVSSYVKVAPPGTLIDVPMNHTNAIYVRSHYDGVTLTLHESPAPDEIALIFCLASRGRLNARVGGLRAEDVKGEDGLV